MQVVTNNTQDIVLGNIILEAADRAAEDTVIVGDNPDRVTAEGTLQDLDVVNRNKRCYSVADMRPQIYGDKIAELVAAKQFKGEAGHPLSDRLDRQQTVDPKMVCVKYSKIWIDKDRVKARFHGTNDDNYGKTFDKDLRCGEKPAFSLRALGSIENINGKAYVKNLRIITYDHVIYPSHKVAYTERLVTESAAMAAEHDAMFKKIIVEGAMSDGIDNITSNIINERAQLIDDINENGRIINITGKDAANLLSTMQHENASIGMILETFEGIANSVKLQGHRIKLTTAFGEHIYLPLDSYCNNLIMEYAYDHMR